ncbi:MAG TPA: YciI family protein [Polyangiaceae bacterium]
MRFMLLVKSEPAAEAGVMPSAKELADMNAFNDEMIKANVMLAGEGLKASSRGARVRCNKATKKVTVLDGPFAEAKELVAGFWIIQAKSKDEAIEWAKRVPFERGEVEVRPIFELEDFPADPKQGATDAWRKTELAARESLSQETTRGTKKMRFIGFVKGASDSESGKMPETGALEKMGAFVEEAVKAGVFLGGEGLKPTSAGSKVRYDGAKRTVLDGPFTETKEIVAGYSILAVDSKEEAVEWTKRFAVVDAEIRTIPEVECEIREIFEAEDFPPA